MKIITWNVNGIRAVAKKNFKEFIAEENPDILCIQEPKAFEDQFLKDKNLGEIEGYKYIWHKGERAGYAGTVIFYKKELEIISEKNDFGDILHFNNDGRFTEIEFSYKGKNVVLMNGYFPNGGTRADGTEMVSYKLDFYTHLQNYTRELKKSGKEIIITGDFNIVHTEIDIARPKQNQNSIGFLPIEREKIGAFINDGNLDVFRHFYPEQLDTYSWWSYRAGARANNVGWRIDYFVVNKDFIENVEDIIYMTETMGSDHCPVKLILK
ncbi:MAG: exodeoxyribonuclease III [Candidatus Gracilibacteria bacterium]|nr:exodeoxyribonuclease III [Candidatus Gracilibacteria bacterium]MDQ7023468.1 exodeoxyribonuclease III [Candidatus Gracilibacteria bacterium]